MVECQFRHGQLLHKLLPWLIVLGVLLALASIYLSLDMGAEAAEKAANGDYGDQIVLGAAGLSANVTLLGAAAARSWYILSDTRPAGYDHVDRLSIWLILTFLTLGAATLFAALNVDGAAYGLGIVGAILAFVSQRLSVSALKWGEDSENESGGYELTWKHRPWSFNWGGIFFPENTKPQHPIKPADRPTTPGGDGFSRTNGHVDSDYTVRTPHSNGTKHWTEKRDAKNEALFWKQKEEDKLESFRPNPSGDEIEGPQCGPGLSKREDRMINHRRLSSTSISILSTLCLTVASLFVWFLFFKGQGESNQAKPRRRTTITKKRPTFVKGKRRATHQPTLSTLRSEGNLLAN